VQKLLTFSRRRLVHPEIVDLNRRLMEFKPLIDQAAGGALLELELKAVHAVARLDEGQFETAILNLVTNARDAMGGEGRIVIATSDTAFNAGDRSDLAPGVYVRVTVTDTGPGMDAATAARAFEPFFTTKESGAGTGLGLSQVYGFAQQAGGAAGIRARPGEGTTVELLLPVSGAPSVAEPPPDRPVAAPGCDGEAVLVVDDDAAVRELTAETLRDLGYRTMVAENAEAALERLRGPEHIDLIFSDVVMPGGMNGLQLSREAQRLRPGLKVLLTSGYAASVLGGTVPAQVALLSKPFTEEQLATQLRTLLAKRSLRVAEQR
jgi:CheY-like chemotaxis protein